MTRQINIIKIILGVLIALLIIVDIILASGKLENYPTYSKLFFQNKCKMLWFVFAVGCLVGKIFYNRTTPSTQKEIVGIAILAGFAFVFWLVGQFARLQTGNSNALYFGILVFGIIAANQLWPQYVDESKSTMS